MCQICGSSSMSYASSDSMSYAQGGSGAEVPVYGGSGANTATSQGATGDTNTNGVLSGVKWSGGTLTYSFPTLTSQYEGTYGNEITNNFSAAPEATRVATRYAMNLLSQYTNMVTTEVSGSTAADVRTAFSDEASPTAYAYYPSNGTKGGDIWYSNAYPDYANPIKGQYGWTTVIHELGHALGLKHGHQTGGPGNTAMQSAFDQMAYSVMTYRAYQNAPLTGYTNETNGFAQTFMMYDIAALQTMYGANFNTNSGNTTYTWNASTGEMSIDGVGQGAPGGNRIFMTLWDGNGTDTYDFSNYATSLSVNLTPGSFSITSATQIANLGNGNFAPGNIFNALQFNGDIRSLIENAIGGSGNDTITGNAADNVLNGGLGNDTLSGGDGDDILNGGDGDDTLIGGAAANGSFNQLNGDNGSDTTSYASQSAAIYADLNTGGGHIGGVLTDLFTSIENLTGGSGNDTLVGNGLSNRLVGGAGDDLLFGNDGNDFFVGGSHVASSFNQLWGGNGIDTADYSAETGKVFVDLRAPAGHIDSGGGYVLNDLMNSIENVIGGSGDDILVGTDVDANVLNGGAGTDLLFGFDGNDTLIGGSANVGQYNQLWGGNGIDTASYFGTTTGVYADLTVLAGWVRNGSNVLILTDVYNSIESLTGGSAADTLVGDNNANRIFGGAGADILYANRGASADGSIDTFEYAAISDSNLTTGYDTIANFLTGQDRLDLSAFGISAAQVLIQSGGGSTSFYANVDGIAGYDLAIVFIGNNAIASGDIIF